MIANRGLSVPLATMAWPPDQPFRRGGGHLFAGRTLPAECKTMETISD